MMCSPIFEWYVVRCRSKNEHIKGLCRDWTMCSKYAILSRFNSEYAILSRFNSIYNHLLTNMSIITLKLNKIFNELQKIRGKWLWAQFGFTNHLALIAWFTSYEKWVHLEKYPNNTRPPYWPKLCRHWGSLLILVGPASTWSMLQILNCRNYMAPS